MALDDLSSYTYGTTRLGDDRIAFDERVRMARAAMDAGVWFHTSHQYGDALKVERAAFAQDRSKVPSAIFKIGWSSVEEIRGQIVEQLEAVGKDHMEIGQLCLGGEVAEQFRDGGPCYEGLNRLKEEGLVGRYVLESWPWNSQIAIGALKGGYANRLVDGLIFYLNPLQRFVTNELWDLLMELDQPIVAMRTVSGGDVYRIQEGGPDYLRPRAASVIPLYERSGCASWPEFCIRYVYGFAQVRTTVGATSRVERLQEFVTAATSPTPLPEDVQQELLALQRKWSDEHDRHAEPWSM